MQVSAFPLGLALAGLGLGIALPARAQAPAVGGAHPEIAVGANYITGDYGNPGQTTDVIYAPLTATLRAPTWRLEATVPFIQIHGPDSVAGAEGSPVVVGEGSGRVSTRQGLGDVTLGAAAYMPRGAHLPLFEASTRVKLPTAAANLGTGRADVSGQVAAYQPVTPRLLLLASAGYQWLGSSSLYKLKSGPTGMAGFNYKVSSSLDAGATVNFTSRIAEGLDHQVLFSPYLSWRASKSWGVTTYVLAGLTRSSPAAGGGLQLTVYR